MSYWIRRNYFKDYFFPGAVGDHAYYDLGGMVIVPGTNDFDNGYDDKWYWWDYRWVAGASPWHRAEVLHSTKFYATTNHEYATVGPYTKKFGTWCLTDGDTVTPTNIIESAHEEPPSASGGAVRPGFNGQFGKTTALEHTGTMYEFAFAYQSGAWDTGGEVWIPTMPEPGMPATQFAPFGISIYYNGGAGNNPDGIHIIILPIGTELTLFDTDGNPSAHTGAATGKILVCIGAIHDPYNNAAVPRFTSVTEFGAYNNGDAFTISEDTEYFLRAEYWPESKTLKNYNLDNDDGPNLDRRLRIYMTSDKKQLPQKLIGEIGLIDYTYTSPKDYIALFTFNYYSGLEIEPDQGYFWTLVQFDETVVGSQALPTYEGTADMKKNGVGSLTLSYQKDSQEQTHDAASTSKTIPAFFTTDRAFNQIELWSKCEVIPWSQKALLADDFVNALAGSWTVNNVVGAWGNEVTPITGFTDKFNNAYTNKGNDPDWTITAGAWDTITTSRSLWSTGAASTIYIDGDVDTDFVFDTEFTFTYSGAVANTLSFGLVGGAAGDIIIAISDGHIILAEYRPGLTPLVDYTGSDTTGKHKFKVIRIGAYIKIYLDGDLVIAETLGNLTCSTSRLTIDKSLNNTALFSSIRVKSPFSNSYAYMFNGALSTATQGDIFQAVAGSQDGGFVEVTVWEAFDEGDADGEFFIKLHYDNGAGGTNWLGLQFTYTDATATKALTLYHDSGTSKAITLDDDLPTVNFGYSEHKYQIWWSIVEGAPNDIIQVAVYSGHDGRLLGEYTGITEPYPGSMRLEIEAETADGCESPYFGIATFFETPVVPTEIVEVPVFHGEVRKIIPEDDNGLFTLIAYPMSYRMKLMRSFDTGPLDYLIETSVSDEALLKNWITEGGDDFWRWFHFWNFNVTLLPGTWIPHRRRGWSVFDIFNHIADYSGLNWQTTPEMQFLYTDYYRNFWDDDILELSTFTPEGLYMDSSTLDNYNKSQTNRIMKVTRVDDATLDHRVGETNLHGASFQDPFQGGAGDRDQVWGSLGAAHADPRPTDWPAVERTGNLATTTGYAGSDKIEATIGAQGPPGTAATDPTNMLQSWGDSILLSASHKNELFEFTLLGSKQWFRPMDKIEAKNAFLDPTTEEVFTTVYNTLYVIHRAVHSLHTDTVIYTIGRIEIYDDQGDIVGIDGYGDAGTPADRFDKTKDDSWNALSGGLQ